MVGGEESWEGVLKLEIVPEITGGGERNRIKDIRIRSTEGRKHDRQGP
jgi:hypothetical protein